VKIVSPGPYALKTHKNRVTRTCIGFTRVLWDGRWKRWLHLVESLMCVHLTNELDSFVWHLTSLGVFSIKSLYEEFLNEDTRYLQKYIWKLKVPLK
jgi:hypothetical protein